LLATPQRLCKQFSSVIQTLFCQTLDYRKKNSFALLKEIRLLEPADNHVPVIAMTALGGIVERQRAMAAGFQELLRKPFDPAELLRAIQSVRR
jgi:CheY-like chemotaxis protein